MTLPSVTTVASLDLDPYLGLWFEICRLPLKWEPEDASDITAHYTLSAPGRIRVENRCRTADGQPLQAVGEATPLDDTGARLAVSFLPAALRWLPFTKGDYWVLRTDYRQSLVGSPDRRFLWLLARDPALPEETRRDWLATAAAQGFDLTGLIVPRHSGPPVTDAELAAAAG